MCFHRQVKDDTIRRGYFQKSVVVVSRLPYFGVLSRMVRTVAPNYFDIGTQVLEVPPVSVVFPSAPHACCRGAAGLAHALFTSLSLGVVHTVRVEGFEKMARAPTGSAGAPFAWASHPGMATQHMLCCSRLSLHKGFYFCRRRCQISRTVARTTCGPRRSPAATSPATPCLR